MSPLQFPLLTDENIHSEVVQGLASWGKDVRSIFDVGLRGSPDADILRYAHARCWVIVTHDSDFGTLTIRQGEPYTGIIYIRPGHILPAFTLETLAKVDALTMDAIPPFIVVAERREALVRIRVRNGSGGASTMTPKDGR